MKTIPKIVLPISLLLFSCESASVREDLIVELEKYESFIEENNDKEFGKFIRHISFCNKKDSALNDLKHCILKLNEIERIFSKRVLNATKHLDIEKINKYYQDSLSSIISYNLIINKQIQQAKSVNINSFTLPEAKSISIINFILLESKIRNEILSQWAIDCDQFYQ